MFDHIDYITDKIINERICNFSKVEEVFRRTSLKTQEKFRITDIAAIDSLAEDLYFNIDFLKSDLDSLLLLLNSKGIRIFFDKLKQKIGYQDERALISYIKLSIIQGKQIEPTEKPNIFAYFDPSFVLPYYEGITLDFDINELTNEIVKLWMGFLIKVDEVVTQLEKEYSNLSKEDDILVLKPTIWGMSLNLNKIWKKYFTKSNGR